MTLLLAGSCSELVFVATDRRVCAIKHGRVSSRDDDRNKALTILCGNAGLLICWTGLANLANAEEEPVDKWLLRILRDAKVESLPGGEIVNLIASHANNDFEFSLRRVEAAGYPARHEFIIAGWCYDRNGNPFAGEFLITNCRDEHGRSLQKRLTKFRILYRETYNSAYPDAVSVFVGGQEEAVSDDERAGLRKLLQTKPSNRAVAGRIGAIIRKASKHPTLGKYISKESRGRIIRPEGVVEEFQWPQMKTGQVFGQIVDTPIIFPHMSVGGMWAATGKLGKIFKANDYLIDVFYTLDIKEIPIRGNIECDYPQCDKVLEKMWKSGEIFTLHLEDSRKLDVAIEKCETINHQRRYKIVAKGDFLIVS